MKFKKLTITLTSVLMFGQNGTVMSEEESEYKFDGKVMSGEETKYKPESIDGELMSVGGEDKGKKYALSGDIKKKFTFGDFMLSGAKIKAEYGYSDTTSTSWGGTSGVTTENAFNGKIGVGFYGKPIVDDISRLFGLTRYEELKAIKFDAFIDYGDQMTWETEAGKNSDNLTEKTSTSYAVKLYYTIPIEDLIPGR
uniref:Uncharacterized protein n=1 Tax=Candidatus Kentrum sp. FW TaxID=2126338 RepID=A0A450U2D8_9GAMM|nr:MAG: hypothetical protein BECKFW1821C_GA0114237_111610 [Candidatus Kentron sp. FW]